MLCVVIVRVQRPVKPLSQTYTLKIPWVFSLKGLIG